MMSFSEGNFISFRMGAMGVAVCSSSLSQLKKQHTIKTDKIGMSSRIKKDFKVHKI